MVAFAKMLRIGNGMITRYDYTLYEQKYVDT